MTEVEAVYQISYNQELLYTLMQWWLGVSVGILAVGNFFSRRLSFLFVLTLVAVYALYTLYVADNISWLVENQVALKEQLQVLRDNGEISAVGLQYLESGANITFGEKWGFALSAAGMFFGCILYLIYRATQARRQSRLQRQ